MTYEGFLTARGAPAAARHSEFRAVSAALAAGKTKNMPATNSPRRKDRPRRDRECRLRPGRAASSGVQYCDDPGATARGGVHLKTNS